jgi:hypothetical protein
MARGNDMEKGDPRVALSRRFVYVGNPENENRFPKYIISVLIKRPMVFF